MSLAASSSPSLTSAMKLTASYREAETAKKPRGGGGGGNDDDGADGAPLRQPVFLAGGTGTPSGGAAEVRLALRAKGLERFTEPLLAFGVESAGELHDPEIVSDETLLGKDVGMSPEEVRAFRTAPPAGSRKGIASIFSGGH